MVTGCDWYPTLLELCGLAPADHTIDGKSLLPILTSREAATEHPQFHWKSGPSIAVREGPWKLLITGDLFELYNISEDPGELNNLKAVFPEKVTRLRQLSRMYWDQVMQE